MIKQQPTKFSFVRLALIAIGLAAGVGAVVPAFLVRIAGWPLPRSMPDVGETWTAVQQQNVPSGAVVGVLACIAWVIWLQLAWAFVWEVLVNTRRLAAGLGVRPAPFVASGINKLVARVASGAVAISILATSPTSASTLPMVPTLVAVEGAVHVQSPTPAAERASVALPAKPRWLVAASDTAWSIAERALGDGSRFGEIAALNPHVACARDVSAGSTLLLPEGAQIPADRQPQEELEPKTAGGTSEHLTDGFLPADEIVIVDGDHLWGLSEERLERASGASPSNLEILEHVEDVIDINRNIIEDPDLIFPGEIFTFPQIGDPPPAPVLEIPAELEPAPTPVEAPALPVQESPTEALEPDSTTGSRLVAESAADRSVLPYLLGLIGSTVLATNLLLASRRRKRRLEVDGVNLDPDPETEVERVLTKAANLPLIRWAGQELSSLITDLRVEGGPIAVEVSENGLEILWDEPTTNAPHPWEATDGGAAWRLLYDADAAIPADELPPALPALVTVGARPGEGVVLLDLEAFGSISVSGDDAAVCDFVRSAALELATGSDLASADILTVGFEVDAAVGDLARVSSASEDDALAILRTTVDQYGDMIASTETHDSFEMRCISGPGPDVVVVVLSAANCSRIGDFVDVAVRRRGVVVMIVGDSKAANARIVVSADGSTAIEPLGLLVQAPAVTVEAVSEVAGLLEQPRAAEGSDLSRPQAEAVLHSGPAHLADGLRGAELNDWVPSDLVDLGDANTGLGGDDGWELPESPLVVRLMGDPRAADLELSVRQLGLVALIASKGGEASAEFVLDHLWADQSNARTRKTLWNLESTTRSVVGPEILPHSPKNQPLRTTATTDVIMFEKLVERADQVSSNEAVDLLAEALELIAGPPFDHCQLEWARSIGIYEPARQLIEKASLKLCELAVESSDIDRARHSIDQGLLALGVNEPLYRARMRVEAAAGDCAAVVRTYRELEERLETLFGDAQPSSTTRRLRDELLNSEAA